MKTNGSVTPDTLLSDTSDIFGTVEFPLKPHVSPHGRVTAVSMMKDEGPFLLEWVAHHLSLGFTDLLVYTNDCSDGTDDMLIRMEQLGLVHHRRNDIPEGIRPQPSALNYAQQEPIVRSSDWVLVFDGDEFLCIKVGDGTVDGLLSETKAAGANGVVITWRIYGSNGVQDWSRAPVTEQYLSAAPPMWNKGWGVKTLFQFDPDYWKLGIHRPKIKNKHLESDFPHSVKWLNGSGRPMEEYFKFRGWRSIVRTVGYDWAQMNHYAIKSMDSYAIRKFRGNVNNKANKYNADYWSLQDRNEVFDASALTHKEKRQEIFDLLLTDPVLSELHSKAIQMAEARLASFKDTPDYNSLISELRAASQVPITQVEAKPPKARDKEKIAAQMSEIEKKMTRATEKNPRSDQASRRTDAHLYVSGQIDLSDGMPLKSFENHKINIPADPRIFTDHALQAITEGKFMRNHARRLPGLLLVGDSFLEIGAGVGFLAAHLSQSVPGLKVTAQEERTVLYAVAKNIWQVNKITPSENCALRNTPLFQAMDGQKVSSGLETTIRECGCTVLYVNDPRLTASMIANSVRAQERLPRVVIAGPRSLDQACDKNHLVSQLSELSYTALAEQPLNNSVTLARTLELSQ